MKKTTLLLIIISSIINISVAQKDSVQFSINSSSLVNLVDALNSENIGLRKSAIFLAGYYRINEVVEPLKNILNSSTTDLSIRTLAAYSLHNIGSEECLHALEESAGKCKDPRLCMKCKLMCDDLMQTKTRSNL